MSTLEQMLTPEQVLTLLQVLTEKVLTLRQVLRLIIREKREKLPQQEGKEKLLLSQCSS